MNRRPFRASVVPCAAIPFRAVIPHAQQPVRVRDGTGRTRRAAATGKSAAFTLMRIAGVLTATTASQVLGRTGAARCVVPGRQVTAHARRAANRLLDVPFADTHEYLCLALIADLQPASDAQVFAGNPASQAICSICLNSIGNDVHSVS